MGYVHLTDSSGSDLLPFGSFRSDNSEKFGFVGAEQGSFMSQRRLARILFVFGITGMGTFLGIIWAPQAAPPIVEYVEAPRQTVEREAPTFDMTVRRDPPPEEEPEEVKEASVAALENESVVEPAAPPPQPTPPLPAPVVAKPKVAPPKPVVSAKKSPEEIRATALREKISGTNRAIANLQKKLADDKTNFDMQMQRELAAVQRQFSRAFSSGFPQVRSMPRVTTAAKRTAQNNARKQQQNSANAESAETQAKIENYQSSVNALQTELKALLKK